MADREILVLATGEYSDYQVRHAFELNERLAAEAVRNAIEQGNLVWCYDCEGLTAPERDDLGFPDCPVDGWHTISCGPAHLETIRITGTPNV